MSASMKAAIHMGSAYTEILEVYKNTNFEELLNVFDITQKLVHEQCEILKVNMIYCASLSWTIFAGSWWDDQVVKGKSTILFRFCLMLVENDGSCRFKSKMVRSSGRISTNGFSERTFMWNWWRTDWVRVECFPRTYVTGNPQKKTSNKTCKKKTLNLQVLKIESSSCRCSMILIGREEKIQKNVFQILNKSRTTRRNSRRSTGHSLDVATKRSGMEDQINPPEGKWQDTANMGGTFRGIWTSSIQRCFSTGSWDLEEEEQGNHTLQCGYFENLRSSRKMVYGSLMKSLRNL